MHNNKFISVFLFLGVILSYVTTFCFSQNIDLQQDIADSLYEENQYAEAALQYINSYSTSDQLNEQNAKNAFLAGKSYHRIGKQDSAILWYSKASEDFYKLKKWDNHYIAQGQIADILDDKGSYKVAIEITENVVAYFKEQKDSVYATKTLNNLALYHYHYGNIQQSIQIYEEAISWAGETNNNSKAKCYNQLGNIWADDLKDEEKALEYYQKSLQLKIQSSAPAKSIAFAYNNIGISHKNLGQLDSAMYYYQQSLDFAIKSNDPAVSLTPLINIANLQKKQGDFESAIHTYKQGLEVTLGTSIKTQATLHINIGIGYNELNNHSLALHHLIIAEELTETTQILVDKRDIHQQKAVAYNGLKNFEKAYQEQEMVILLNDSLHKRERDQEIAELMIKYESAQKDKAILEQQQTIQQKELDLRTRNLWFVSSIGLLLLVAGFLFFLFKRKQAMAKQAALELKLAEEKERTHLQEERLRISRELHDNIGSYLTLINASIEQLPEMSSAQIAENYPDLQKALSLSMRELRKTVWLLNNQEISIDALALRLRDFFKPLNQNGTKITVKLQGDTEKTLTDIQATHLFRLVQEAVNNAYKYAQAQNIGIHLKVTDKICFSIIDDGIGFEVMTIQNGNGLQNMQTRMEELKGEIQVLSEVGKGTKVNGCF